MFDGKGRYEIEMDRAYTLEELLSFMEANWNKEKHGDFSVGKTALRKGKSIKLSAGKYFDVAIFPKSEGNKHQIIVQTAENGTGLTMDMLNGIPLLGIYFCMKVETERDRVCYPKLKECAEYLEYLLDGQV